jgi:hypothetical protein
VIGNSSRLLATVDVHEIDTNLKQEDSQRRRRQSRSSALLVHLKLMSDIRRNILSLAIVSGGLPSYLKDLLCSPALLIPFVTVAIPLCLGKHLNPSIILNYRRLQRLNFSAKTRIVKPWEQCPIEARNRNGGPPPITHRLWIPFPHTGRFRKTALRKEKAHRKGSPLNLPLEFPSFLPSA